MFGKFVFAILVLKNYYNTYKIVPLMAEDQK